MPYDPGELTLSSSPDPLHPRAPDRRPGWGGRSAPAGNLLAMDIANLDEREPFTTLDGSTIREIAGRTTLPSRNQRLAEATVPPGSETIEHFHRTSEEIYLFTRGMGRMHLGDQEGPVRAGDAVVIAPGVRNKLVNTGQEPLVLLCCCAPAYSHDDTVLVEHDT